MRSVQVDKIQLNHDLDHKTPKELDALVDELRKKWKFAVIAPSTGLPEKLVIDRPSFV